MYHFRYVTKKELSQTKKEITELIHCVQDKVREEFTFQYEFIGSTKRNMVTYDPESNVGFDFDVNIKVNGEVREHSPEEVKKILMRAFDNHVISAWKPGYDYCEDSTRVFTIKVKDRINSRILYSCDFAVVYDYEEDGEKRQQYIKFNKEQRRYTWEEQRDGFYRLPDKINFGSMKKVA